MPFTIAHVVAAAPIWRLVGRRLVFSGLVVGAMSPDFEYLARLEPHRTISHTPLGAFVFCVPASLLTLALWHKVVAPAFVPLLPGQLGTVADHPFRFGPMRRFGTVCLSALVGALSHLAWDSFTNGSSPVVRHFAVLSRPAWAGGPPLYEAIWYSSSAVGVLFVSWWLVRMARRSAPSAALPGLRRTPLSRTRALAVVVGSASSLALFNAVRQGSGAPSHQMLVAGVIGAMSGAALAAVATGMVFKARMTR